MTTRDAVVVEPSGYYHSLAPPPFSGRCKKINSFYIMDIFKSVFFDYCFFVRFLSSPRQFSDPRVWGDGRKKKKIDASEKKKYAKNIYISRPISNGGGGGIGNTSGKRVSDPQPDRNTYRSDVPRTSDGEEEDAIMSHNRTGSVMRECYGDSREGFDREIAARGTNVLARKRVPRPEEEPRLGSYYSLEAEELFHPKLFGFPKTESGNPVVGDRVTDSNGRELMVWYPGLPAPAFSLVDLLDRKKICKENVFLLVPRTRPWTDRSVWTEDRSRANPFLDPSSWRYEILLSNDEWVDVTEEPRCRSLLCPSKLRIDTIPDDNVRIVEGNRVPVPILPPRVFLDRRKNVSSVSIV